MLCIYYTIFSVICQQINEKYGNFQQHTNINILSKCTKSPTFRSEKWRLVSCSVFVSAVVILVAEQVNVILIRLKDDTFKLLPEL